MTPSILVPGASTIPGLYALALLLTAPPVAAGDSFQPVTFERERTVHIKGAPDEVYSLLAPDRRPLWSQRPTTRRTLFPGWGETLSGAMYWSEDEHHGQRWEVMAEDDPEARLMRWIVVYPEVELLVAEMRCAPGPDGGTDFTLAWRVIGLSVDGNQAVREFFAEDGFERGADKMAESLNRYLEGSAD